MSKRKYDKRLYPAIIMSLVVVVVAAFFVGYYFTGFLAYSEPGPCAYNLRGDVNQDSRVDVGDAGSLLLFYSGLKVLPCPDAADVNGDGEIKSGDLTYLLNYLFSKGPEPPPFEEPVEPPEPAESSGDVNRDGKLSQADVDYYKSYLFSNGEAPESPDLNGDGNTNIADLVFLSALVAENGVVEDKEGPAITVLSPLDGEMLRIGLVEVKVEASDASGVREVLVNSQRAQLSTDGRYSYTVSLSQGRNNINIVATDSNGNSVQKSISVVVDLTPVTIPGTGVYLESSHYIVSPGASFDVRFYVRSAEEIKGMQGTVSFDNEKVQLNDIILAGTDFEGWNRPPRIGLMGAPGFFVPTISNRQGWGIFGLAFFVPVDAQYKYRFSPGQDYHAVTFKFSVHSDALPAGRSSTMTRIRLPPEGTCAPDPYSQCLNRMENGFVDMRSGMIIIPASGLRDVDIEIRR